MTTLVQWRLDKRYQADGRSFYALVASGVIRETYESPRLALRVVRRCNTLERELSETSSNSPTNSPAERALS